MQSISVANTGPRLLALCLVIVLSVAALAEPAFAQADPTAPFVSKSSGLATNMRIVGLALCTPLLALAIIQLMFGIQVMNMLWKIALGAVGLGGIVAISSFFTA